MSTARQEASFLYRWDEKDRLSEAGLTRYFVAKPDDEATERTIRYVPTTRTAKPAKPAKPKLPIRVLRRLRGFLVEMSGAEARVAFVENGKTIPYDLPADQLRRSGIECKNQPFQMDEIEMQTQSGLIVGYRFQALAKSSDAYIESLNFDEDRKRKRDLILKEFGKAKG